MSAQLRQTSLQRLGWDDLYAVDSVGDVVDESASTGDDHAPGANREQLTLIGTGSVNGTGDGLANTLIGNSGANRLGRPSR